MTLPPRPLLALLVATALSLTVNTEAAIIITAEQTGGTVVFSYTGSLDVSGLTPSFSRNAEAAVSPANGELLIGTAGNLVDVYSDEVITSPPAPFGTSPVYRGAGLSSGDAFAIVSGGYFHLPSGYISGSALSGTAAFDTSGLSDLGLIPGSYVWQINGGANGNTVTLNVSPEPARVLLAGIGLAGMLLRRRRPTA